MADTKLKELIEMAHALGSHPARLVLWSEGSCALKTSPGRFLVTRRGAVLARLTEADMVELDSDRLSDLLSRETVADEDLAEALKASSENPPSADALLYAHLLGLDGATFAFHTHPVEINQITCSPRARQFADRRSLPDEVLATGVASLLVPYADPGLNLAREFKRKLRLWRDRFKTVPRVILLSNHGMITLGASCEEVLKTTEMAIKSAQTFIGAALMGGPVFLSPDNVMQIEQLKKL
jgi:rhamnose utilization protein RhaD (predicted bifunctional aldolase and dehydrogenase)